MLDYLREFIVFAGFVIACLIVLYVAALVLFPPGDDRD